ncbi:S1 family peptidase [Saccharopolyspora hattusasensis]|uniref:S1 family peptidase n=1 Tax=Saccharopolyspora hattusasensis TaxID=1128679 RepID=UPI003D996FD1
MAAPGVVATCAHVVGGATPVADFPLLGSHDHAVEVLSQDDDLDVAILRLANAPSGALPVPARITGDVRDHRFRTFGFPRDMPDGIWVTGRLVGAQGPGRIQMAVDPDRWRIKPGFSGAPVWDEELRGIVVMVATTSARSGPRPTWYRRRRSAMPGRPRTATRTGVCSRSGKKTPPCSTAATTKSTSPRVAGAITGRCFRPMPTGSSYRGVHQPCHRAL